MEEYKIASMKKVFYLMLILFFLCACNNKGQKSVSSSVADNTCVIKLKNPQKGYAVSFVREKEGCTINLCKGDSVLLYIETARLPRCLSEYDSVYGKYTVDFDIPIVKLDTLDVNKYDIADVFFMDVNFDGKEDFVCALLGNGKLLYECYDIENEVVEGKKPKLVKPLEEEPYSMFASADFERGGDYVAFDYEKKEIFILTTSCCCIYYNTWAKLLEGGQNGDKPCVKIVKQEHHTFQNEGDGGIEKVETYVLKNDSLELVEKKDIPF